MHTAIQANWVKGLCYKFGDLCSALVQNTGGSGISARFATKQDEQQIMVNFHSDADYTPLMP